MADSGQSLSYFNRAQVIALCAQTLNITPEKLEQALDWNANYMAWHDGGSVEETHVWPKENSLCTAIGFIRLAHDH